MSFIIYTNLKWRTFRNNEWQILKLTKQIEFLKYVYLQVYNFLHKFISSFKNGSLPYLVLLCWLIHMSIAPIRIAVANVRMLTLNLASGRLSMLLFIWTASPMTRLSNFYIRIFRIIHPLCSHIFVTNIIVICTRYKFSITFRSTVSLFEPTATVAFHWKFKVFTSVLSRKKPYFLFQLSKFTNRVYLRAKLLSTSTRTTTSEANSKRKVDIELILLWTLIFKNYHFAMRNFWNIIL